MREEVSLPLYLSLLLCNYTLLYFLTDVTLLEWSVLQHSIIKD